MCFVLNFHIFSLLEFCKKISLEFLLIFQKKKITFSQYFFYLFLSLFCAAIQNSTILTAPFQQFTTYRQPHATRSQLVLNIDQLILLALKLRRKKQRTTKLYNNTDKNKVNNQFKCNNLPIILDYFLTDIGLWPKEINNNQTHTQLLTLTYILSHIYFKPYTLPAIIKHCQL